MADATIIPNNPFRPLIELCANDATHIQTVYTQHRATRLIQQRNVILCPDFPGPNIDATLRRLLIEEEAFVDPRHNLVLWARPTASIRRLVEECQRRLSTRTKGMWMVPQDWLHMTVLEMATGRMEVEIEDTVDRLAANRTAEALTDYMAQTDERGHRARLIKPMLGFDAAAVALTFIPDDGDNGEWGYHHLRRDLWDIANTAPGVKIQGRYIFPSAHITIGRFMSADDWTAGDGTAEKLVTCIDEINKWLESEFLRDRVGCSWTIGAEGGLELRKGTCWYGGGDSVRVGKGLQA